MYLYPIKSRSSTVSATFDKTASSRMCVFCALIVLLTYHGSCLTSVFFVFHYSFIDASSGVKRHSTMTSRIYNHLLRQTFRKSRMSPNSRERRPSYVKRFSKFYHPRDETPLEQAVDEAWEEAAGFVAKVPAKEGEETLTFHPDFDQALFCGHVMADLDSIAGAIGAAHLYGGVPARASDVNSETKWALEKWSAPCPAPVEELLEQYPDSNVCLVDFQQQSQLNDAIPMDRIVGIIDHHALQSNTIITARPIFVDIRPWGSMSAILAHSYAVHEHFLPKPIAGMLLSAILSDTLNLRSPTTTKWDERMVSMLVQYLRIKDVNELAAQQFRAKSHELSLMTPYQLVNGDMKQFKFDSTAETGATTTYVIGYGVIETTDAEASLQRIDVLIPEMQQTRLEQKLTAMLLAVVDIINLTSSLFLCGPVEESLALKAYGGSVSQDGKVLELPGLVSRKNDFVPPLTRAMSEGWQPPSSPKAQRCRSSHIVMDWNLGPGLLERVYDDLEDNLEEEGEEE